MANNKYITLEQLTKAVKGLVNKINSEHIIIDNKMQILTNGIGNPLIANTAAEMIDTTTVYLYTGSENGYINGNWYFYNGTTWIPGGIYNSSSVPKYVITGSTPTQELTPNYFYIFDECSSLTITFATPTNNAIINEYHFRFTSGNTATTLTLPASVTMPGGFQVEANSIYEISIIDNLGTYAKW